jgi:haloalkane dehalogenase
MTDVQSAPAWLDRVAYPFRTRALALSSGRVHYVDEGNGPSVLFVHGTPTWSFEYRHLIQGLRSTHRCVAPDHLGFGLSERPAGFAYTPEAHAAVLREFVERLDLRDLTLVVHDFGGPIGLPLAIAPGSRVGRVVLINTWMWPLDSPDMRRKAAVAGSWLGRFLYKYANFSLRVLMPSVYGRRAALTREIHRQYLEVFRDREARVTVLHALARALKESAPFYARLRAAADRLGERPALIVWGMKDTAFGPDQLDRWRHLLPAARIVALPDAGHWPHEEQPEAVTAALISWLNGLD